jgi:hypothetical protein
MWTARPLPQSRRLRRPCLPHEAAEQDGLELPDEVRRMIRRARRASTRIARWGGGGEKAWTKLPSRVVSLGRRPGGGCERRIARADQVHRAATRWSTAIMSAGRIWVLSGLLALTTRVLGAPWARRRLSMIVVWMRRRCENESLWVDELCLSKRLVGGSSLAGPSCPLQAL